MTIAISLARWAIALSAAAAPAAAQGPAPGAVWDWQLDAPLDLSVEVDVLGLDPDLVSAADIAALRQRGVFTICYVSVGTAEDWRDDFDAFPDAVVGHPYPGWAGEFFLDLRALDILLPIMEARFARCAALGFDAVEPDNIDINWEHTGFELVQRDSINYLQALAGIAHGMGLQIGQKNAPDIAPQVVAMMDFAIVEDAFSDLWWDRMQVYFQAGKPVFAAEYSLPRTEWAEACAYAAEFGVSIVFKDVALAAGHIHCP